MEYYLPYILAIGANAADKCREATAQVQACPCPKWVVVLMCVAIVTVLLSLPNILSWIFDRK